MTPCLILRGRKTQRGWLAAVGGGEHSRQILSNAKTNDAPARVTVKRKAVRNQHMRASVFETLVIC